MFEVRQPAVARLRSLLMALGVLWSGQQGLGQAARSSARAYKSVHIRRLSSLVYRNVRSMASTTPPAAESGGKQAGVSAEAKDKALDM